MSTTIDPAVLQQLVAQAVKQLKTDGTNGQGCPISHSAYGIFDSMGEAIDASAAAQKELLFQTPTQRETWCNVIGKTCLKKENMEIMSRMAVEETEIGRVEDKITKNTAAAKYTPGIENCRLKPKLANMDFPWWNIVLLVSLVPLRRRRIRRKRLLTILSA